MGEKIAFPLTLFLFAVVVIPMLFNMTILNKNTSELLNVSTEFQKIVNQEGGKTEKVKNIMSDLAEKGVVITMKDSNGNAVNGKADVGTRIIMNYKYTYLGAYGDVTIPTANSVTINKR